MSNSALRFGIVGTGMIANVIAQAINTAPSARLAAVSSRSETSGRAFADNHGIEQVVTDWNALARSDQVDAIYIATPTTVREPVCLAVAASGKHVLADKPFDGAASLERIQDACRKSGVAFMDATHFTHHPRTHLIKTQLSALIGRPLFTRSTFYYPVDDRANIRFDPRMEPTGAVGDMAWYNMRSLVEYFPYRGKLVHMQCRSRKCDSTGSVMGGTGLAEFQNLQATFTFGYDAGALLMDLDLVGEAGAVQMSDFVLDWTHGVGFPNPGHTVGFSHRKGAVGPGEFVYRECPSELAQNVLMIEKFVELARQPQSEDSIAACTRAMETQRLCDAVWGAIS